MRKNGSSIAYRLPARFTESDVWCLSASRAVSTWDESPTRSADCPRSNSRRPSTSGASLRAYPGRQGPAFGSRSPTSLLKSTREASDGSCLERRWLANAGLAVGAGRSVVAGSAYAPVGLSPAPRVRSRCDGRDPARVAHRDAVERLERDRDLHLLVGSPPLSGVGAVRRVPRDLAARIARLRRDDRDRLGLVVV